MIGDFGLGRAGRVAGTELRNPYEREGMLVRNLFANLCLLLVSCVAGLALCEVSLRLFYPKYRHLAEAQFRSDAMRIWARTPNHQDIIAHPDTRGPHLLYHNNLALRQHRNFHEADLASATNIGFFGDSFTENTRMPVQYSFTEPLDYLLNQGQRRFNVLNFGVEGYGLGQSLLHYEHFRHAKQLDHVFYVYCQNDIFDIYATGLFHLNETGHLVWNEAIRESWWTPLIRRWHTPYLVLDASGRLSSLLEETAAKAEDRRHEFHERFRDKRQKAVRRAWRRGKRPGLSKSSLEIVRQLIRRWKSLAEHNGSTFSVVLLPSHPPQPSVVALLDAENVEVVDLYACFGAADPAHPQRPLSQSPYYFKADHHWNEAGNRLAAVCLHRVLEEKLGLPKWSEADLWEASSRYYAAFGGDVSLKAGGGGRGIDLCRDGRRDSGEVLDDRDDRSFTGGNSKIDNTTGQAGHRFRLRRVPRPKSDRLCQGRLPADRHQTAVLLAHKTE